MFIYHPEWVGSSSCKLTITNLVTNEQIIYNVKGVSEEPLSEDHFYLNTHTGKSGPQLITIQNPYSEKLLYRISTDLAEVTCLPDVILEPKEKINLNLNISTSTPGISIGYVKLMNASGRFFWYSLTI